MSLTRAEIRVGKTYFGKGGPAKELRTVEDLQQGGVRFRSAKGDAIVSITAFVRWARGVVDGALPSPQDVYLIMVAGMGQARLIKTAETGAFVAIDVGLADGNVARYELYIHKGIVKLRQIYSDFYHPATLYSSKIPDGLKKPAGE